MSSATNGPLLSVEGLVKHFKLDPKGLFEAPPIPARGRRYRFRREAGKPSGWWANRAAASRPRRGWSCG